MSLSATEIGGAWVPLHLLDILASERVPLAACEEALRRRPSALLVDVDGTISPIAPDPQSAFVLPGCRDALARLTDRVYLVGVLSGRPAEQAHSMVGLDSIEYWGAHGVSHLAHTVVRTVPEAEKFVPAVLHVQQTVEAWDAEGGILVEPKRTSVAVHYRLSSDPVRTRDWLYARLAPLAKTNGLDLLEGRMVFELRPPGLGKGWCIQRIIHERSLAGVVYVGDDQTDVEAFAAIDTWRNAGPGRTGVTVAVENSEASTRIPLSADHTVKGVSAVERLLLGLADRL